MAPNFQNASAPPVSPSGHDGLRQRPLQVTVPASVKTGGPVWTFPGTGSAKELHIPGQELSDVREKLSAPKEQLSEWPASALCGNDILSSVLYAAGIVTAKAGKLAPIPLLFVVAVLYFFRFIYEEVVTAIPLNGGSYNVLLNTMSKKTASFGAALGIISYLATCVVSATSGVTYLSTVVDIPIIPVTIALLGAFAILSLFGITDSSRVAMVLFFHHVIVLTVLIVSSFIYVVQNTHIFKDNMHAKLPDVDFAGDTIESNVGTAIFFGFGASMLGITGFESSAQFVEEQKPGIFRKTLRNMWAFSSVFNTINIFMALGVLPLDAIYNARDFLLAEMGLVAAGNWLKVWICIDAMAVLSGAVLTSYVGIVGLVRRLASDRVLPAFLLTQNKWRRTNHYIIVLFFLIASSLVLILDGNIATLSGVYTYAFLSLMALFSCGCMVLKVKRAEIPRDISAPWWSCIMGFIFVIIGILANLLGDPKVLMVFAFYLIVVVGIMMIMLVRVEVLKVILAVLKTIAPSSKLKARSAEKNVTNASLVSPSHSRYEAVDTPSINAGIDPINRTGARGGRTITKAIMDINELPIVFFAKTPDLTVINKAILYVRKNEQTHNLRIVHVSPNADDGESGEAAAVRKEFENVIALFDHIYPKLRIDFVHVQGEFEPAVVKWTSEEMQVPINLMFIAQPGDKAVHSVSKLGVRVITG